MTKDIKPKAYLQVSSIPFFRLDERTVLIDKIWANELKTQSGYFGRMLVLAPQSDSKSEITPWGPSFTELVESEILSFIGVPNLTTNKPIDLHAIIKKTIEEAVNQASMVHSSNIFPGKFYLSYAHFYAAKQSKKTFFVVAEDFYNMAYWEWIRPRKRWSLSRLKAQLDLFRTDLLTKRMLATSTIAFINTPAAVNRYSRYANQSYAIRHTNHSSSDVISTREFETKTESIKTKKKLNLIAVCRHSRLKGVDLLIEATALLKSDGIPFHLKLYGMGPETENLSKQIARLNLEQEISLEGPIEPGRTLFLAMAESDLCIMPHRTNDFGRTFYDAMVGGTPVVAFKSEASVDTVNHNVDGLLCPMENILALTQAIESLAKDRRKLASLMKGARERALYDTQERWLTFRANISLRD